MQLWPAGADSVVVTAGTGILIQVIAGMTEGTGGKGANGMAHGTILSGWQMAG